MLNFTPSDISFYEKDARTFLIHDKEDPDRNLYYTTDFGVSFELLQSNVKSFRWSMADDLPVHLYVERIEPSSKEIRNALNLFVCIKCLSICRFIFGNIYERRRTYQVIDATRI